MSNNTNYPSKIYPMIESHFGLDGGAMFGIIPRPLWSRTNPPDEQNRIAMVSRCLLIEYAPTPNHPQLRADRPTYVLVDVGMGSTWQDKERVIYNIHEQDVALGAQLTNVQVTADMIDHVIITHLHFDHAGGLSYLDTNNARQLTFEQATHWVQKKNWSWAHGPSQRDAGSYRKDDFALLGRRDDAKLNLIDGPKTLLPGVDVYPQNGHTFGMQTVHIQTQDGQKYCFVADLIPTSSHLRDPYVMGYDLQPVITLEEKRAILHEAAKHDWIIIYEHDPACAMSRIEFDGRGRPRAVEV